MKLQPPLMGLLWARSGLWPNLCVLQCTRGQSMAANAISILCIACTGQHHGEAGAGATRALQLTKMPGFIGHVSNVQQVWDLIPM